MLQGAGARLLGVDTAASLDAVLTTALGERVPDALLVTGDIAHEPGDAAYARVSESIARHYGGPAVWLAGNHDLGAALERARPPGDTLELGDWAVLGIDTHVDGEDGGYVSDAEMARLRDRLSRAVARRLIVAGHHPPVPLGMPWLDRDCIRNGAALCEMLSADSRVCAYVCGHVHQDTATVHGRLRIFTTPSTCFQFLGRAPRFAVDTTPPGWRWLDLDRDGTLSTRVGRAADFAVTIDLSTFKK